MSDHHTIDLVQVRWDGLCVFKYWTGPRKGRPVEILEDRLKAYSGQVKAVSKKRMLSAIDLIIQLSPLKMISRPGGKKMPFRLGFWTLTVPGRVRKATEIQPTFKALLAWMRRRGIQYIWKAEYQARGQVHYHLIVNKYVPWIELRDAWNKRLKKAGCLNGYARQTGHFNPNSVDIRAVKSNKALAIYLAKYLVKENETLPDGRLGKWWGASKALLGDKFCSEMWAGDWDAMQNGTTIIRDPDQNWIIVKGKISSVLSEYTNRQYLAWREEKRKEL